VGRRDRHGVRLRHSLAVRGVGVDEHGVRIHPARGQPCGQALPAVCAVRRTPLAPYQHSREGAQCLSRSEEHRGVVDMCSNDGRAHRGRRVPRGPPQCHRRRWGQGAARMRTRSWSGPRGWRRSSWRAVAPGQRRCWGPAGAGLRCSAGRAGRLAECMNRCSTGSAGLLHRLPLLRGRTAPCATLQAVVQTSRWGVSSSSGRRAAYAEGWGRQPSARRQPTGGSSSRSAAGAHHRAHQERTTAHRARHLHQQGRYREG